MGDRIRKRLQLVGSFFEVPGSGLDCCLEVFLVFRQGLSRPVALRGEGGQPQGGGTGHQSEEARRIVGSHRVKGCEGAPAHVGCQRDDDS